MLVSMIVETTTFFFTGLFYEKKVQNNIYLKCIIFSYNVQILLSLLFNVMRNPW